MAPKLRPPLRWAGSKRNSIHHLLSLIPKETGKIIEPFAGSACFTLQANRDCSTISDLNFDLIEFYKNLAKFPDELYNYFCDIEVKKEKYYEIREIFNSQNSSIRKSANFLYLNRFGFNGIYRVNKSGNYNVPWGGTQAGRPPSLDELRLVSDRLKTMKITHGDFEEIVKAESDKGSLIYLDPPYARDEKRVFREYCNNSFVPDDWERLVNLIIRIHESGAKFILSYAGDGPIVDKLKFWEVGKLSVTRNVGGFASTRRKHEEFIASNCNE